MQVSLRDKVAIVTGASSGIGRAIALEFGRSGARVVVNYHGHREDGEEVVRQIADAGAEAIAVQGDVSQQADVRGLVEAAVDRFGKLDIMVNNAGIEQRMPFLETPLEVWEKVIAVNLTGTWLGCQEAARQMVRQGGGGRIINISSVHEDLPMPTNSPYCAAKGGVRMLARTLAVELAPHKITVNNIAPGAIETPMNSNLKEHPELLQQLLHEIPLGRIGRPEEVAQLALYLASEAASYITGSTYFIDGGMIRHSGSL
ncbi:short-chain dehydrogenase/reductase SDR [Thermobaculum terrenum ATCC BAA-798]|uniref:Short-chain dehydrogenase/reductase SDR n=1 Tax=Thermobaculum terrenum (strain ATCC BAA-798 / CCMEE 7001 / YNP1) TaxID=525904 RepID=D1CH00_THET1|nr:SDR family oxidoreductase [Thermobaculum terrenum]ACZ43021.1 short-chain dehydrogenase/reductase SDR [Thermobaculum terrenum ATCC BAA-798]